MNVDEKLLLITIISTFVALLSAIFAFFEALSAKRSVILQKQIYEDGKARISLENIENSFLYNDLVKDRVVYSFKVIINNLSDKNTSIIQAILKLSYDNDKLINIELYNECMQFDNISNIILPVNIEPHSSISGWLFFELSRSVYNDININTHTIIMKDIHGAFTSKEEISVRERVVKNEK